MKYYILYSYQHSYRNRKNRNSSPNSGNRGLFW